MPPKVIIDLSSRFQAALGVVPVMPSVQRPPSQYVPAYGGRVYTKGDASFEDLHIYNDDHDLYFGSTTLTKSGELGNIFAPPPMIGWRKSNAPITTATEEGEIVERWYSVPIWEIHMEGLLVDMVNHHFPFDRLITLREVFDTKAAFSVGSQLFDALDIQSIYFTDVDISPLAGFQDTCTFRLSARSIKPAEFYLNDEVV